MNNPTTHYVITVNQPGYLPTMEPYEVEGLEEAAQAFIDEVHHTVYYGTAQLFPEALTLPAVIAALEAEGYAGIIVQGYLHEVSAIS